MNIRDATKSDAADIARIHVDTWRVAYSGIVPDSLLSRLSMKDRAKKWAKTLSQSNHSIRVAVTAEGQIVGWTSFGQSRDHDDHKRGELYAIYLDQAQWGKGIGKELLDDAVSLLQGGGFTSITLWVLEKNARARAFYEKAEFIRDGATKIIMIDGKELTKIRYRKTAKPGAQPDAD